MNQQPTSILDYVKPRRILMIVIVVLGIGTVFYHFVEDLKWLDSIYFCVITLATVGYGDIVPHTDAGKIFTIFYVLIGVGIIASSVGYLLKHQAIRRIDEAANNASALAKHAKSLKARNKKQRNAKDK